MERGHHTYIDEGGRLIAEWYDFGEDVPYESANRAIFEKDQHARVAELLGVKIAQAIDLAATIAARFRTKWEVEAWAREHNVAFSRDVDFMP